MTANVRGDIACDPESFFFGIVKKGGEKKAALTLSTAGNDPLTIEKIDCPLSYISVDVAPRIEARAYTLTATLKRDAPVGGVKGEVTIQTDNPDQPTLTIPVYAYVQTD